MDELMRIKELSKIKKHDKPEMTGVKLRYGNQTTKYNVYKIPIELLVYNKYNGRIGTVVKSYEKKTGLIDENTDKGKALIEKFLYESKLDRNEKTLESIAKNGQLKYGIVTSHGIIIDGNRRASLLNRLYYNRDNYMKKFDLPNLDHCRYFLAVILDDTIDKREVIRLETEFQMGEDEKVDYNPIEKYLKCRDLKEEKFTEVEIASMMGETTRQINEWLETLELMDEYLEYFQYDGIYTMLEKREDQFLTLNKNLKKFENNRAYANWPYGPRDIARLKAISFDYIRTSYEGKEFRALTNSGRNGEISGIFCDKDTWSRFLKSHNDTIYEVKEKSPEMIYESSDGEEYEKLLKARDLDFKKRVFKSFTENMKQSTNKIEGIKESNEPLKLLKKAKDLIESIDIDSISFKSEEVYKLNEELIQLCNKYRFKLQKEGLRNE